MRTVSNTTITSRSQRQGNVLASALKTRCASPDTPTPICAYSACRLRSTGTTSTRALSTAPRQSPRVFPRRPRANLRLSGHVRAPDCSGVTVRTAANAKRTRRRPPGSPISSKTAIPALLSTECTQPRARAAPVSSTLTHRPRGSAAAAAAASITVCANVLLSRTHAIARTGLCCINCSVVILACTRTYAPLFLSYLRPLCVVCLIISRGLRCCARGDGDAAGRCIVYRRLSAHRRHPSSRDAVILGRARQGLRSEKLFQLSCLHNRPCAV